MNASHHALAKSLADAAQAMGLDALSALTAELSARMGDSLEARLAQSPAAGHLRDLAEKASRQAEYIDAAASVAFRAASFDASLAAEAARAAGSKRPTVTATILVEDMPPVERAHPDDRLDFCAGRVGTRAAKVEPETVSTVHRQTEAAGDFSRATFDGSRTAWAILYAHNRRAAALRAAFDAKPRTVHNHLQPGDRLTFKAPSGHPLFTVEVERES